MDDVKPQSADFRKALEPWTLGPLRLRNRFIKSATNEGMAPGGVPTQALVRHHRAMAAGGPTPEAERLYASTLARTSWDHESGVALALLLIDDHQPDAALRALDRADTWSRSRESWLARTHALLLEHHDEAALRVMERATTAVPDFLRAQILRARLAARLGRTSEATAAWRATGRWCTVS